MTKTSPSASRLFLSFLRLGLTAFGGPAMIAYIKELSVNRSKWLAAFAALVKKVDILYVVLIGAVISMFMF